MSVFQEHTSWALDAYLHLYKVQMRWRSVFPDVPAILLRSALHFLDALETEKSLDSCIQQKAYMLSVSLCMELSSLSYDCFLSYYERPDRELFCIALFKVAKACIRSKPISRLVTLHLIPALVKLTEDLIGEDIDEDLLVSTNIYDRGRTTNSGVGMFKVAPRRNYNQPCTYLYGRQRF